MILINTYQLIENHCSKQYKGESPMANTAKEQTTEENILQSYEYRELLIKLNIEEDMKAIREPLDFLMYMLQGLAIISHDLDGNDDYVEFDHDERCTEQTKSLICVV